MRVKSEHKKPQKHKKWAWWKTIKSKVSKSKTENERRALTKDEIKKLFEVVKDDNDLLVLFALGFYTGMRRTDAAMLKWENVDFDKRVIHFVSTSLLQEFHQPQDFGILGVFEKTF